MGPREWFGRMLSDVDGNPSSMRFVAVVVPIVIVGVWTYVCIKTGTLQSFEWADVGAIGALGGAKAYQAGKGK